jgi:signal transduction histidine kinase
VIDRAENQRVAFLNRLLGESEAWSNVHDMLAEMSSVLGASAVGLRWPAESGAVILAETKTVTKPAHQVRFAVPQMAAGLLWADGEVNKDFMQLVANAVGHSATLRQALGPIADQARIATRLEDAGRVAGRVAHDLDNVFQGVTGFASLALESLPAGSPASQNLREVESSAKHGLRFCAQLHQLSRGGQARPLPSSIAGSLNREVARIQAAFPTVRFEVDALATLPTVSVEGGGLQAILGHLLENAAEASPKGGTVKAVATLVELAPAELRNFLGCPTTGPHVEVKIIDTGSGVTDEAKRRMFIEPFFTTKFRHRGLSLAVVYRMLYAHRGGVQVDGQPGKGTTIRVVFPLAAARVPAVEPGRSSGGFAS